MIPRRWRVLALACACTAFTQGRTDAEEAAEGLKPEITAKCTEFINKVNAAQRTELDKRMAAEIADVVKVTGLGLRRREVT